MKPSEHSRFATHDVTNQPPPLATYDVYATDLPLQQALVREGAGWAAPAVAAYGPLAGGEAMELGFPPTKTNRGSNRSTASETASTRWNSTRRITG